MEIDEDNMLIVKHVMELQDKIVDLLKKEPPDLAITVLMATYIMLGEGIGLTKEQMAQSVSEGAELWTATKTLKSDKH